MFHNDRDEEAAKADGVRQASILMQVCMCPYCPNQNGSLTQHPSDFPVFIVDQYEISGLTETGQKKDNPPHPKVRRVVVPPRTFFQLIEKYSIGNSLQSFFLNRGNIH